MNRSFDNLENDERSIHRGARSVMVSITHCDCVGAGSNPVVHPNEYYNGGLAEWPIAEVC